jgi:3',5'-cyclic AMP phosphodiesterase CpdA
MRHIPIFLLLLFSISRLFGTVLIYGDTRKHPDVHRQLIRQVQALDYDTVVFTGDMNQKGTTQKEYDQFKDIIRPLRAPFFPVRGNHERDLELYLKNFPTPNAKSYYSLVAIPDVLQFIVLDSNLEIIPGSAQYEWLLTELEQASHPLMLFIHHPVFSSGYHGDELGLSWFLPTLLSKYPVLAVISGHEHSFEHLQYQGIDYFVSGGGGAPLRNRKTEHPNSRFFQMTHHYNLLHHAADHLLWQCFDLEGKLLYETRIGLPTEP